MITVYHLDTSRSERIVWLLEELGLPYEMASFLRTPQMRAAPELAKIHPLGKAPIIRDGNTVLAESGAIVEYIVRRHGGGRLSPAVESADFPRYLYWLHFAEGTLMAATISAFMFKSVAGEPAAAPRAAALNAQLEHLYGFVDQALGETPYFAGQGFSAADIMMVFPFTTMKAFVGGELSAYPNLQAYLRRIGERPAYQRAMQLAGPGAVAKAPA